MYEEWLGTDQVTTSQDSTTTAEKSRVGENKYINGTKETVSAGQQTWERGFCGSLGTGLWFLDASYITNQVG